MPEPERKGLQGAVLTAESGTALSKQLSTWIHYNKYARIVAMTQSECPAKYSAHITLTILYYKG